MALLSKSPWIVVAGAALVVALAAVGGVASGPRLAAELESKSVRAIAESGGGSVRARFRSPNGWPSRHPLLSGGEQLDEGTRARVARAVAAVPGVGGIRWADGTALVTTGTARPRPLDCQNDVEALLRSRTIRFEEASAQIDAASGALIDEVAGALRPCLGNIIAITGHTDATGPEPGNLELSLARAQAVRRALMRRGIPSDGLRARGVGSRSPVPGLDSTDPANRRIEFSVVATEPIQPTPIDTPAPR
jgi:OmpA-OmpF porin, OOP family